VLHQGGAALAGGERVLIVGDRHPLIGGELLAGGVASPTFQVALLVVFVHPIGLLFCDLTPRVGTSGAHSQTRRSRRERGHADGAPFAQQARFTLETLGGCRSLARQTTDSVP